MDNIKNWLNISLKEVVDATRDRKAFGLKCREPSLAPDATEPDLSAAKNAKREA